jgi:hypothetical protein
MSVQGLQEHVWENLDSRRHAVGRARVYRLTRRIIARWPDGPPESGAEFSAAVKSEERREYGMGIILSLFLGAIIQEIVRLLVQWWAKSAANRLLMAGYKKELLSAGD